MKLAFFIIPLLFIVFDIVTGWAKAIATGTTNSSIMRKGLFHKLGEILAIIFGYCCEYAFPYIGINVEVPFSESIGVYIVLMEVASIIENIMKINPQLAKILHKLFNSED